MIRVCDKIKRFCWDITAPFWSTYDSVQPLESERFLRPAGGLQVGVLFAG